jgi:hypothetical protein
MSVPVVSRSTVEEFRMVDPISVVRVFEGYRGEVWVESRSARGTMIATWSHAPLCEIRQLLGRRGAILLVDLRAVSSRRHIEQSRLANLRTKEGIVFDVSAGGAP